MKNIKFLTIIALLLSIHWPNNAEKIQSLSNSESSAFVTKVEPGTIILLNGTSSAGKSTLVHELQKSYYQDFHIVRIDDYIKTAKGYKRKTRYNNFYNHIKKMALAGKNVLVDTVAYQGDYDKYNEILKPCKVIKILVYCSLDALIMHVQKRNESGIPGEQRTINKAFWQFITLYKIQNSPKDTIIDQVSAQQVKNAIVKAQAMADQYPWLKARNQRKINNTLAKEFNIKSLHIINIAPKLRWDFVVNSGLDTPENVALKIVDFCRIKMCN